MSVRLLLDTHALVWWDDGKLPAAVVRRIQRADEVFVSAATAWEVTIKASLGKSIVKVPVAEVIEDNEFVALAITVAHAEAVRHLPHHHRDPFDRILVAQARAEGLTLVSRDEQVRAYDVPVVWI